MARDTGSLSQAEQSGSYEPEAVLRSTVAAYGVVLPTQTRAQRATEAVNSLEARANMAIELQALGGDNLILAASLAKSVLGQIEMQNRWFIDYESTPSSEDFSGATVAIPFGDWADVESRCDSSTLVAIATQSFSAPRA